MKSNGMTDGMATMTHRTTFALDEETAKRLKRLSKTWKVSQAEVVRRAVHAAEALSPPDAPSKAEQYRAFLQRGGGLIREEADRYLAEVREDRKRWRSS